MQFSEYEFGGRRHCRFLINFYNETCHCSAFWDGNEFHLVTKLLPIDPNKISGSFCQYVLAILGKVSIGEVMKNHVNDLTRYVTLLERIGYTKFDLKLKLRLLSSLRSGIHIWKAYLSDEIGLDDHMYLRTVKKVCRYLMIYELILYDVTSK